MRVLKAECQCGDVDDDARTWTFLSFPPIMYSLHSNSTLTSISFVLLAKFRKEQSTQEMPNPKRT